MADLLVLVDFSDVADALLVTASRLAKGFDLKVRLLHVASAEPDFIGYEVGPVYIRESVAEQLRQQHQQLQQYQQKLREEGVDVTAMLVPGDAPKKIIDEMKRMNPDWIVVGSHGHGALRNLLMGSTCESVLKHATCPVVVVPSRKRPPAS